ncbi:11911_t:CDS:2, partial [Gigaspora margarita]
NSKDIWKLVKQLHKTDEQIPKINDPQLYDKFLHIINLILVYCQKLKLSQDNKVIQKYEKLKSEINKSPDPNKFVIDYSVKFKNLPNWIQQNYVKEIEKSIEVYKDEENISIDNDNFTQIICEKICDIKNVSEKFSPFSKKFDPINYRFKPKLISYIKWFENCLIKIAKQ